MILINYFYQLIITTFQKILQIFNLNSNLVKIDNLENQEFIMTKDQIYFKSMSYSTYKYDVLITKKIGPQANNIYTFKPINKQEKSTNLIYLHGSNSLFIDIEFHLSKDLNTDNILEL